MGPTRVDTPSPSGVALLRRMPVLWTEHEPARVSSAELAATLGVPGGTGSQSRLNRTLDRLAHFGLAGWVGPGAVGIYTEVAPLSEQRLGRQPEWTQAAHHRLVGQHLDSLANRGTNRSAVADITARLDQLQQPRPAQDRAGQALGR